MQGGAIASNARDGMMGRGRVHGGASQVMMIRVVDRRKSRDIFGPRATFTFHKAFFFLSQDPQKKGNRTFFSPLKN